MTKKKERHVSVSVYADIIGKTSQTVYNYIEDGTIDNYISFEIGKKGKNGYVIILEEEIR